MPILDGYLAFLAVFIGLAGCFAYIRSMLEGKARPNRVTFFIWALAPMIAAAAEASSNVGLAVIPVFMNGFTPLLIFLSSLAVKKAYWKTTRYDYLCGVLSALALILWYVTKAPDLAILFSIAADGLAGIPTVIKSWRHPETESVWIYVGGAITSVAAYTAINAWSFSAYAFPTYILLLNLIIIYGITRKVPG